ncbi:MAG: hypothetical protein LBJ72_12065 [Dysgonamonadaceae bacterium]|jgi:hypothetical protein|nr:hypothetical protein [Dysgonamonadaceae bacterium]
MKAKKLFLAVISLLVLGCSEDKDIALPSCELKTTFLGEFETEAIILKKAPEGDFFSPSPCIRGIESGNPHLYMNVDMPLIGRICNFPQYAQEWDIPEDGLSVILSGKVYDYDGFYPANRVCYDLELSMIKKKLP